MLLADIRDLILHRPCKDVDFAASAAELGQQVAQELGASGNGFQNFARR